MVSLCADRAAQTLLCAAYHETVVDFFGTRADRAQISHDGRDSIALLDSQLARTVDDRFTHRARSETCQQDELVNHCGNVIPFHRYSLKTRGPRANRTHRFARDVALHGPRDVRPH